MKELLILGAGTAGTLMLNKLHRVLPKETWKLTIVDKEESHYYQPGFLFIPFGIYKANEVVKPKRMFFPEATNFIVDEVDQILPENNKVLLKSGVKLSYDILIIATGTQPVPEETEGLKGSLWYKDIFDFYTFEGAVKLARKLESWKGGKLVINLSETLIKCPVAPLEFAFLADSYFKGKGIREKVEIFYVTPLSGAFTKPIASKMLGQLLEQKAIQVIPDFYTEHVDNEEKKIVSYDDKEVEFDLLISIPTNKGAEMVEKSSMGDSDDLNFIPTNPQTLQSRDHKNIFVIGDATNIPTSKAGSVAHFEGEILVKNILRFIEDKPLDAKFDGHANCFIETGDGKATLIDFSYDTQPLPGKFPIPGIGPMSLLKETRLNHMGKLAFKWVYWNMLLTGKKLPVSNEFSLSGKNKELLNA